MISINLWLKLNQTVTARVALYEGLAKESRSSALAPELKLLAKSWVRP